MRDWDDALQYALACLNPKVMAADTLPEVVLFGGPKDGLRTYTHAPIRDELQMPATTGIAALTGPVAMHIYQLDYVDGRPSRDDGGAYVYRYRKDRG